MFIDLKEGVAIINERQMAGALSDAAVIGAGIEGSATAYYLLKKGLKNVLLLEQV